MFQKGSVLFSREADASSPEAVVTSIEKESLRSTKQVLAVL